MPTWLQRHHARTAADGVGGRHRRVGRDARAGRRGVQTGFRCSRLPAWSRWCAASCWPPRGTGESGRRTRRRRGRRPAANRRRYQHERRSAHILAPAAAGRPPWGATAGRRPRAAPGLDAGLPRPAVRARPDREAARHRPATGRVVASAARPPDRRNRRLHGEPGSVVDGRGGRNSVRVEKYDATTLRPGAEREARWSESAAPVGTARC